MGAIMRAAVEIYAEDRWQHQALFSMPENVPLMNLVGLNISNSFSPIYPPKGMPEDASAYTNSLRANDHGFGDTFLYAGQVSAIYRYYQEMGGKEGNLACLQYLAMMGLLRRIGDVGQHTIQTFRVVFWFVNN